MMTQGGTDLETCSQFLVESAICKSLSRKILVLHPMKEAGLSQNRLSPLFIGEQQVQGLPTIMLAELVLFNPFPRHTTFIPRSAVFSYLS
jgi:hypothetical protein